MIRLDYVSFAFPGAARREVLKGITLSIGDGEWVAVAGGNGSGKTTLCRVIAGVYRPGAGTVTVDGTNPAHAGAGSRRAPATGIAFQNPDSQFVTSSVERELLFGLENLGTGEDEMKSRLAAAARLFSIERHLARNPHSLSGGEKQRLVLACLWAMGPRHLILDEPFSFLDALARKAFLGALRDSFRREGKTILWSTVDEGEMMLADRVIFMDGGEVRFDGAPGDLARSIPALDLDRSLVRRDPGTGLHDAPPPRARRGDGAPVVEVREARFSPGGNGFELDVPSFSIAPGERVGICGPSGSGKTTLLLGSAGLLPPLRGEVALFGARVASRRDFPAGKAAFLFQSPEEGFFAPTVREEVSLACRRLAGNDDASDAAARSLMDAGLSPELFLDRNPFHLSQGEKRLVALASVLVMDARLYLLDEPTIFLDGAARRRLISALERISARGAATVVASHDRTFLGECTNRIVALENGRLL